MEFIHGVKTSNVKQIRAMGIDTRQVAQLCVQAFADMMFQAPFLHVDPHAGNLFVRKDPISGNPQLVLLDHGMYNYFESGFNEFLQNLWLAMVAQDSKEMDRLCRQFTPGKVCSVACFVDDRTINDVSQQVWRGNERGDA